MNPFDLAVLGLLIFAGISGFRKGFILEIFSFLAFFLGLFLAMQLTFPVTRYFFGESPFESIVAILVFFLLFLLLVWLVKIAAAAIKSIVHFTLLGWVDRFLGVLISVLKWVMIASIVLWIFESFQFRLPDKWTAGSITYPFVQPLGPILYGWLTEIFPFFQELLEEAPVTDETPREV